MHVVKNKEQKKSFFLQPFIIKQMGMFDCAVGDDNF